MHGPPNLTMYTASPETHPDIRQVAAVKCLPCQVSGLLLSRTAHSYTAHTYRMSGDLLVLLQGAAIKVDDGHLE